MRGVHAASSGAIGPAQTESRSVADQFFAGFTFNGNQSLGELAAFYGLTVPALEPCVTLGQFLVRHCYGNPRPGYRIAFCNAELIVRELEEGAVTKVGLRLVPRVPRPQRRRWPFGASYSVGASLVRPTGGARAAALQAR